MKNLYLIFILAALFLVNCATLTRGTNEPYKVVTQPPGAVVTTTLETVDSIKARKNNPDLAPSYHGCSPTPCEFIVPRRSKFIVRIEREDYEPAPGATLSLYPNPVALQLNPVGVTTEYNYDLDTLTDPNQTYARKKAANSCGFDKIICE